MTTYYKRKNKKRKGTWIGITVIFFVFLFLIGLFLMYDRINVTPTTQNGDNVTAQRTMQTIEQTNQESKTIEDKIEETTKSVVGISKIKNNGSSIFLKDGTEQLGLGSGFIVSENGYIVTNEHVSGQKYSNCYVTLETGKVYSGKVVWSDSNLDLSIVKINMKSLPYVTLGDSEEIRVGQSVYAIGNPIGYEFQRTVTSGIISAKERTLKFTENNEEIYMSNLIQTDAGINPGNSGGPLIDNNGNVIGINSVKITSAEGIGFAAPINVIKPIIQAYIRDGNFEEASIGIFAYDKNVIPYLDSNLKFENGIYVAQIARSSPAEKAGIKMGDVIKKIDNIELSKMNQLKEYIYTKRANEEVTLSIQRDNVTTQMKLILGKK